jgi:hypothetical protein
MRVLRSIIPCAVLAFSGSNAIAQVIDDDTKCAAIENIIQTASPDRQKVVNYIVETMRALDRVHGLKGKIEIFPQLTEDGRSALALIVTDRCRTRGSLTVADTAIETYEAIRAIKPSLVQSKPLRAHSHIPRQHSQASALDQHPVPTAARHAQIEF